MILLKITILQNHISLSPAWLALQITSLLSPCALLKAAPSPLQHKAWVSPNHLLRVGFPCPMDDKMWRFASQTLHSQHQDTGPSCPTRQRRHAAEPRRRRRRREEEARGSEGGQQAGSLQPGLSLGSPPAWRRRHTTPLPCQIPKSNDLC